MGCSLGSRRGEKGQKNRSTCPRLLPTASWKASSTLALISVSDCLVCSALRPSWRGWGTPGLWVRQLEGCPLLLPAQGVTSWGDWGALLGAQARGRKPGTSEPRWAVPQFTHPHHVGPSTCASVSSSSTLGSSRCPAQGSQGRADTRARRCPRHLDLGSDQTGVPRLFPLLWKRIALRRRPRGRR